VKKQDAYCLKQVTEPWFRHMWINFMGLNPPRVGTAFVRVQPSVW
jgi:hypothetical protein